MSNKEDLPLLLKYDCLSEYNKITECIKVNKEKINKCDVNIINSVSYLKPW
jgi:hypothetical protein